MKQVNGLSQTGLGRGDAVVSEPITFPARVVEHPAPPRTKWEREYQAFRQLLPQLLATHRGQYVAIHEGTVVDSGDDKLALALRVLAQVGNVAIHVGLVSEEPEPVSRSGVRRELRSCGGPA
jgi:hypothetical protein